MVFHVGGKNELEFVLQSGYTLSTISVISGQLQFPSNREAHQFKCEDVRPEQTSPSMFEASEL